MPRRRDRDIDEDDDRPRRESRDRYDDDEDEPQPRRKRKVKSSGKGTLLTLAVVGGVLLIGGIVTVTVIFVLKPAEMPGGKTEMPADKVWAPDPELVKQLTKTEDIFGYCISLPPGMVRDFYGGVDDTTGEQLEIPTWKSGGDTTKYFGMVLLEKVKYRQMAKNKPVRGVVYVGFDEQGAVGGMPSVIVGMLSVKGADGDAQMRVLESAMATLKRK